MRGGTGSRGYTIIEVMIFLAVSGFMFVLAAVFVSGKQATTEFQQGMNDISTQIQQTINDVSNGFYPSTANFTCSSTSGGLTISTLSSTQQGQNAGQRSGISGGGCVFLGKIMQFATGNNPSNYAVYTVAGSQFAGGATTGDVPTTFAEAQPTVIDSLTQPHGLEYSIKITSMKDFTPGGPSGGRDLSSIGFFGSFGQYTGGVNNELESGSQTVTVVSLIGTPAVTDSTTIGTPSMASVTSALNARPQPDVVLCFRGAATQYGTITIGGSAGQRLTTSMNISGGPINGCPA